MNIIEKYIDFCEKFLISLGNCFKEYPSFKNAYLVLMLILGYFLLKRCFFLLGIRFSLFSVFENFCEPLKCILPGVLISIVIALMISF